LKIAALVPMRHHSERVAGKNYREFAGRPLYHHIVQALVDCPLIDEVVIDTDSPTIMEDASSVFPQVRLIERPEALRADTMPMNEVLLHDVCNVEADYYLQTHSTNPLLKSDTINLAIESFLGNLPAYDSLFGVTRLQVRLWNQLALPVNHNSQILLRTQDLPPIYMENSNMYIFSREILEVKRNRIGERPFMFEVDSMEAWDIDDENGFQIAEAVYGNLRSK
jgi:CMP-N-acetylneuraminic acid synthetase